MTNIDVPLADIRDMYAVHTVLRRELGLVSKLVGDVAEGDTQRSGVVGDHLDLMLGFLHTHHSGEDAHIWPRLLERAPREVEPVVHTMESQHHAIETAQAEIVERLKTWRGNPSADSSAALAVAVDRLNLLLNEHLDVEETVTLPIIAEHITAAEWNSMVQEGGADVPPEQLPLMFGMMMYDGDPEVVQLAVDNMPPEIRPVVKDLAAQAYADYARVVYGTATPPRSGSPDAPTRTP